MKKYGIFFTLFFSLTCAASLKEADKLYIEGSYQLALEQYSALASLPSNQMRWVQFRIADCTWRATTERTKREKAKTSLEEIIRSDEQDKIWAEAQESLGDYLNGNWGNYQQALDWWAGSSEIATARKRYLNLIWKASSPLWKNQKHRYYWKPLPLYIIENGLRIAQTVNDQARLNYLLAKCLMQQNNRRHAKRILTAFEHAIKPGKGSAWHDDALFAYARYLERPSQWERDEEGSWNARPDFDNALKLYKRLVSQYSKGETQYFDECKQRIKEISAEDIQVLVSQAFLPGSVFEYTLHTRNISTCVLALYPIDLSKDIQYAAKDHNALFPWLNRLQFKERKPLRKWAKSLPFQYAHEKVQQVLRFEEKLPAGAYVLEARAKGKKNRALVLISEHAVVLKTSNNKALAYFAHIENGAPVSKAALTLHAGHYDHQRRQYIWRTYRSQTDQSGCALFNLPDIDKPCNYFLGAVKNNFQAFASHYGSYFRQKSDQWRIYTFTDRPAYRPEDTVKWKCTARTYNQEIYTTPSGEGIQYRLINPRGSIIDENRISLNTFGSAWGELKLKNEMPLGIYRIEFLDRAGKWIGSSELFRLEEYKLPEFKVKVQTSGSLFRIGDTIDVTVLAEYYFGGPVADAEVEIIVKQRAFYPQWSPPRECSWLQKEPIRSYHTTAQEIKREKTKTDAEGKARIRFSSENLGDNEKEFIIIARVTDASRREIIGQGAVKVTRQSYYVYAKPEHRIYAPGNVVTFEIHTLDANNQPVKSKGRAIVFRKFWNKNKYLKEKIMSFNLESDDKGFMRCQFTPSQEGYYSMRWINRDESDEMIETETECWVSTEKSSTLGYQANGINLILDRDTVEVGEKAPVLFTVPANNRYVLFTIEGDDLYHYELIHLKGTAFFMPLYISERFTPNVFLGAQLLHAHHAFRDVEELIVPPTKKILDVELVFDRETYAPGEKGIIDISTRDFRQKPVSTEISLSAFDEAVLYIQSEFAQDPRQFFYGNKRKIESKTTTSFNHFLYQKLDDEKRTMDDDMEGVPWYNPLEKSEGKPRKRFLKAEGKAFSALAPQFSEIAAEGAAGFIQDNVQPVVKVRSDFRSTLVWRPDVTTDMDGKAQLKIKMPDALTTWQAKARAVSSGDKIGIGKASVQTKLPLMIRLQTPRFLVVGDKATISAIINNETSETLNISPELKLKGVDRVPSPGAREPQIVKGNSETRVEWTLEANKAGMAKIEVKVTGGNYGDAMTRNIPIYKHGIEKLIVRSGKAREKDVTFTLDIPAARQKENTILTLQLTPSLAITMLDALPYLVDFPYGCTEQTMSRFLPAVIVTKTLKDQGLKIQDIEGKVFGGIEQEFIDKTHAEEKQQLHKLDKVTRKALKRLYTFQHGDGGWGWWKKGDSDHFMTAYIIWGLSLAKESGIEIKERSIQRGQQYLNENLIKAEDLYDLQAWMLHALSYGKKPGQFEDAAVFNLWKNKDQLNAYTRALFAMAMQRYGRNMEAEVLVRNLKNGVILDDSSVEKTAHWGETSTYWRWSEGGVEATAFVLQALLAIDPMNALIEPAMNWLVKNRRGAQWSNTRDTAITLLALNAYLRSSKELLVRDRYEIYFNQKLIHQGLISPETILNEPSQYTIPPTLIRDGTNTIRIKRENGESALYYAAFAKFFSLEEPITPAGNELFIKRDYFRIKNLQTLLKGTIPEKVLLRDGDRIHSGERVEAVLTMEAKNHYEYLVVEDLKPAGFETVQVRSGEDMRIQKLDRSDSRWIHQELRDRKTAFFIDKLTQGIWEIRYELRAETPGTFHGLPPLGHAMYVPEIRCNGAEALLKIRDEK